MAEESLGHLSPSARQAVEHLRELSGGDAQAYLSAALQLYDESTRTKEQELSAFADYHTSIACFILCRWNEALFHANRSIETFRKTGNDFLVCRCYNLMGILFATQGDMALAVNMFSEAIDDADEKGFAFLSALARSNYCEMCFSGGEYETVIRVSKEAMKLYLKTKDDGERMLNISTLLIQQAGAYLALERYDEARAALQQLDALHREHPDFPEGLDEKIVRLFYDEKFAPANVDRDLAACIKCLDEIQNRNNNITWILKLMENLQSTDQTKYLAHVVDLMEKDLSKSSYPHYQLIVSKYRLDLCVKEKKSQDQILEELWHRIHLADQEQEQATRNFHYYLELQKKLSDEKRKATKMRLAARTDSLTGLANRRGLEEEGQKCFLDMMEQKSLFGIEILDIDHFKEINDSYGHEVGDLCLQHLGKVLQDEADHHCLPFRYGGDEFVILYVGLSQADIEAHASSIRVSLRTPEADLPLFTVSQGICLGIPPASASMEEYLFQADGGLYQSKREGRDRVNLVPFKEHEYRALIRQIH